MKNNSIRIAVRKFTPFEITLQEAWASFCAQSGCGLQLEMCPMDLPKLYDIILEKNGEWDIAHISSDWIKEAINNHAVESLTDFDKNLNHQLSGWPESLLRCQTSGEKIFGIPFHDGPECFIYRKDLFENTHYQSVYKRLNQKELAPPKNWEDFFDIATFFSTVQKGLYGTAIAAFPDGHNAVYDFCIHLWTRGVDFVDFTGKVQIDTPKTVEGLAYYRSLFNGKNIIHPDSKQYDSVALGEAFAKGEIAMMINWFGFAAYAELAETSLVKGKIGIATIPCNKENHPISPNSYWMYSVGTGSNKKKIAYDFIRFATSEEQDIALTINGGIGCRKATWHDKNINDKIPCFHQLEALHTCARELPDIPNWHALAEVIDRVMSNVIDTDESIETIIRREQAFIDKNF